MYSEAYMYSVHVNACTFWWGTVAPQWYILWWSWYLPVDDSPYANNQSHLIPHEWTIGRYLSQIE